MIKTSNARSVDNHVELKIVTQKTRTFASHFEPIDVRYRDGTSALLFAHVMAMVYRSQIIDIAYIRRGKFWIYISICERRLTVKSVQTHNH